MFESFSSVPVAAMPRPLNVVLTACEGFQATREVLQATRLAGAGGWGPEVPRVHPRGETKAGAQEGRLCLPLC